MKFLQSVTSLLLAGCSLACAGPTPGHAAVQPKHPHKIAPKVFIISMFEPEAEVWWGIPEFNLLAHNITVPGASPLFPDVYCTADYSVCQLITGEGEINAAVTVNAVAFSPLFDLRHTYFFVAGIAGVNPKMATTAGVIFARYAVQVALQYEIDIRELPRNYSTGYIPMGSTFPDQYPQNIYGTEVFEVNADLRSLAVSFAKKANLSDTATAKAYRANYATQDGVFKAATEGPSVVECDVATSDVYYSGLILGDAFDNTTTLLTNGTGKYCASAQEDNATLEALLRSSARNLTDFSRIIVMRTASDFDRPYPGVSASYNLFNSAEQDGFTPAIQNLYVAGIQVVEGILAGWNSTFAAGVKPRNYVGDIFATLGGTPDFGPGRAEALEGAGALKKRGMERKMHSRAKRS
ncbi:hypothetical protein ASPWEDRAFT_156899 [Aspergillus wentii DTO 134E9]|uniref:Purine nucleoside permease n=1 Tax=Aspergillus wentii DTO 134E9 TaxID=1073089 RepID=A0A1L9RFG9_ASPWE|nr:uncharacterized protein ASPWEDRAFT_156899 [Aspergillus wentii DTO 134E9]KAI9925447.1 hypothetical protein MW887_005828 [Aspergillus wentii]OJJ33679.1 hypothetical protein ASPWEDRAFT_156899 [Aspergillus wentii DTO 134E9]